MANSLNCGDKILVLYADEPDLYHIRVIGGRTGDSSYLVCTPDFDVYIEDYSLRGGDILTIRVMVEGRVPFGVDAAEVYRMPRELTADELEDLRVEAVRLGGPAAGAAREGGGADAAAAGGARVDPALDRAGGKWYVGESGRTVPFGAAAPAGAWAGAVPDHGRGVGQVDGVPTMLRWVTDDEVEDWRMRERPVDARILKIKTKGDRRHREWRDLVADVGQAEFGDWPVAGPRTAKWCLDFLDKQPGGPDDHHVLWRTTTKLTYQDWGVQEHQMIMAALTHGGTYDQYDLTNSALVELLLRRAQTIEYSYSEATREATSGASSSQKHGCRLTFEEQSAFGGTRRTEPVMVSPALLEHVKKDVMANAELLKSLGKAREARETLKKK
eukprot:TRINITY_DN92043_c0_g1_i1.p1 TRINITY_DN92043_c0_g1~~TRINITY_DN92043_c0_g1_i1.p1  ORF type:complete len:385 (-),score=64.26 TRINITY_DN92043_c0_g1_i1:316-1470(-)